MSILLFGAEGQLGRELAVSLRAIAQVTPLSRAQVDLCIPRAAADAIGRTRPHLVVNAAAYTNVDRAESEPELAQRMNGDAVGEIAQACATHGAHFMHFSTDYVFAGSGTTPHRETDTTAPLNVYGRSKLEGERQALDSGCKLNILRTSWLHSPRGKNFIRTILLLAQERDALSVVSDQHGAPTSAPWLARVASMLCSSSLNSKGETPRVLHAVPRGSASWHEVAQSAVSLAIEAGMQVRINPDAITAVLSSSRTTAAQRPLNSRLSVGLLEETIGITCPEWMDGVRDTVSAIAREDRS